LQKTHGLDQLTYLPSEMKVESLAVFDEGADAFIDTAAIMQNLDLVVTSDTATAHLAGALGCPTWLAVKHMPDWRWMLERSDSPWYPTMRLFRQPVRDDWDSVFSAMADALVSLALSRSAR
jgi:ADP-heptose:LPS heptosyltransferase